MERVQIAKKSTYALVSILSVVNILGKRLKVDVTFVDGDSSPVLQDKKVTGASHIVRYIARMFPTVGLYGNNPLQASTVDYWADFADSSLQSANFASLNQAFTELNGYLTLRTFLTGFKPTLADILVFSALRASPIWLRFSKGKDAPCNLLRWYNHMSSLPEVIQALSTKVEPETKKDQGSFDIDLAGATEGNVVTRFPPEPSGYLHIGHAKAALLNEYFARTYKGRLIVRFDDTNPSKEKVEFEESILEDIKMLGIQYDSLTWTSDYFDKLHQFAIDLIKAGKAYVDDTPQETMREERMAGLPSKNRDLSVDENLKLFADMSNATEFGLTCCLRAKMSVDAKNKALRDPVIYRCNLIPHNRTGDKWKIYPTYDFACPIVDSIEGVTHALRTNEYHDRNDQYYWFIDALGLRKPHIWDYSRVNFVYTLLSKRKLQWFVDQKYVEGWDDPRFPTVRGILRRGLTVEALKKYILMQGASKNNLMLSWDKLWTLNKQIVDSSAPRYWALVKEGLHRATIIDGPEKEEIKEVVKHKKNPDLGSKETVYYKHILLEKVDADSLSEGEEITLMDWGNAFVGKILGDGSLELKLHLEGDFKKTKKKLTWLSDTPSLVPVKLFDYDYLITKKKLDENDSFEDCVNEKTVFIDEGLGDKNLKSLKHGDIIQLERKGFYIVDSPHGSSSGLCLLSIPDGRAASVALKAESKDK